MGTEATPFRPFPVAGNQVLFAFFEGVVECGWVWDEHGEKVPSKH